MIERKIEAQFEHFYSTTKMALLVTGARQIGKSFSIRRFGVSHFESFIEINFIQDGDVAEMMKDVTNAQDILMRLSVIYGQKMIKGKTLIFFDEVQECPEIVTAIKFLVEEGSFRYILSGSLLGVELKNIRSVPVGYMDIRDMHPVDFEEFIQALGVGSNVVEDLQKCWDEKKPVDNFIHRRLMQAFRLYLIVGGMPAALQKYIETNNLQLVMDEQKAIIAEYKKDITKYDQGNKLYIEEIFDLIPSELNAKNKRFILKNLNDNLKFSRYENSFIWLKDAGAALPAYNVEEPKLPLLLNKQRNLFKLFQSDIGLLACQYANGIQLKILNGDDSDINFGAIYENVMAQELSAHGFDLYYFNSKRQGEVDFVIERDGECLPLEVKSGKDYERHRALSNILMTTGYGIKEACVLSNENLKVVGKITYAPIYMTMFIKNKELDPFKYKLDMSGL